MSRRSVPATIDHPRRLDIAAVSYFVLAAQGVVYLAAVAGMVRCARRGQPGSVVRVATAATLAVPLLSWLGASAMFGMLAFPSELMRSIALVGVSLGAIPLAAAALVAVALARRSDRPHIGAHWLASVVAGLLVLPLAHYVPAALGGHTDAVYAVDVGGATRSVMHPTPEERIALARVAPACSTRTLDPARNPGWRWQTVKPVNARLPMPVAMHDHPDEIPNDPALQQWGHDRWGSIDFMLEGEAQQSTGYFIGGGSGTIEPSCGLRVASMLSLVRRFAFAVQRREGSEVDSMFTATTDIPFALPDTQLGIGISAHTRAGRDTLLSIVAAIVFVDRARTH